MTHGADIFSTDTSSLFLPDLTLWFQRNTGKGRLGGTDPVPPLGNIPGNPRGKLDPGARRRLVADGVSRQIRGRHFRGARNCPGPDLCSGTFYRRSRRRPGTSDAAVFGSAEILHSGKRFVVHAGGCLAGILPGLAEAGVDVIEGVAGPPQGDTSLADALPERIRYLAGLGKHR